MDDPAQYGAIAAANSLSDVYAMGGRPLAALNIAAFPADLPHSVIAAILAGGAAKAAEAGIAIVGGHTITDDEPKYGLAVTGVVNPREFVTNAGARAADVLVLTKPIGTGVISTAGKNGQANPEVLARASAIMATLNRGAAEAMRAVGANACTDVTGFGLLGHLRSMLLASGVAARISRAATPVIEGTLELLDAGIVPGGTRRNLAGIGGAARWHESLTPNDKLLMCDAQTSGGLLISTPKDRVDDLVAALRERETPSAAVIGEIVDGEAGTLHVTP